ncbi:hypothetical protein JW851_01270 [Candidatus Woesearchaeota archaeon]|nr:hypothetical protein [Candidatus Woesearchaeota archaeon]
MEFQISFTKRVFFIVVLVGLVSMVVFLALTQPTGDVVRTAGQKITNTIAITGVNVGESIGKEFPALTESHLLGLATTTEQTNEGRTQVKQYIRLHGGTSQTHDGDLNQMTGGTIVFERNEQGKVGDFLKFDGDEDMFEYEIEFSSGFKSVYNSNHMLVDLKEETLNLLGGQFAILEAKVDTSSHWIEIKMIGPGGTVELKDLDYTDIYYTDHGLKFNGKDIQARVMIRGHDLGNNKFSITSIKYRPQPMAKGAGKHVYVEPKHGVQEYLREPQMMLTPEFEIIYGGLSGGPAPAVVADVTGAVSTEISEGLAELINAEGPTGNMITGAASASGNMVWFKPTGDDQYDLIASTNIANYKIGLASTRGGLHWGDEDQNFVFTESANAGVFNINQRDYFMVSSGTDIGDYTSIIMYENILTSQNKIQYRDLAGGSKQAAYDPATGYGQIVLNGRPTDFYVSLASPYPITVDLTQDGNINGARAEWVLRGGPRLRFSGAGTVAIIAPRRLFHEAPAGDETTTFTIGQSGGDITLTVANQATLTLRSAEGGVRYGLTPFGFEFEWNDHKEPEELRIGMPGAGIARPFQSQPSYGAQAGSYVVVTLERSKLAKKK